MLILYMKQLFNSLILVSVFNFLFTKNANSIDYLKLQNKAIHTSCQEFSLDSIELTLKQLLAIDSTQIENGLYEYYSDLSMVYYMKSKMYKQNEFENLNYFMIYKCISVDRKRGEAYHALTNNAYIDKRYCLAKNSLILYKRYTEKKYWNMNLITMIETHSIHRVMKWIIHRTNFLGIVFLIKQGQTTN